MNCIGICGKYKASSVKLTNNVRYAIGQKYCSNCQIFTKWDGLRCPCCNLQLRTNPRNQKSKKNQKIEAGIRI